MEARSKQIYFPVSSLKFILMSICTLGIYPVYWSYKNWRYIKSRDHSNISPIWRAIFYPVWYYSLLTDINSNSKNIIYKVFLVVILLCFSFVSMLPDPYWLLSLLMFLPIMPAVYTISKINVSREVNKKYYSHRPVNYVAYFFGGILMLIITLLVIGFFPSTMVVPGNKLWERDLEYLRSQNILEEKEDVLYFYSFGSWSIEEDGQFITGDHVTSYFIDPDDNSLFISKVAYEDIERFDISWSGSWLEDTIVTVTNTDGDVFEIWLSEESEGDKIFIEEMDRLWKIKKKY